MLNDNFEKYEFLVKQEVAHYKELIVSKGFLNGAFSLEGYEITHSQKTAYDLYTDQDPPLPYVSYPELIGNVVPSNFIPFYEFQDIRDKIRSLWMELDDDIWDYVRGEVSNRNLHLKELKDIDNFIYNDFLSIIAYKSFAEIDDKEIDKNDKMFLEKQIEVYKNGGFPCGWKGEFPDGVMVVYSPE